jgi:hypothetical protein
MESCRKHELATTACANYLTRTTTVVGVEPIGSNRSQCCIGMIIPFLCVPMSTSEKLQKNFRKTS